MKRALRLLLPGARFRRSSSRSLRKGEPDRVVLYDFGTSSAVELDPVGGRRYQLFRPVLSTWDENGQSNKDSDECLVILACAAATAAAAAGAYEWTSCGFIDPKRRFQDIYHVAANTPLLGSGSFGTVSSAIHRMTGEIVAVKKVPRAQDVSFDDISWEVEVLKVAGEHRNVTQFYDVFQDDDFYYLTMEIARGGELFDLLIEQGPPSEQQAAALMRALIGAVAFVHMHGIIHGDIKPENVFLTNGRFGEVDWQGVRLGDFGSSVEVALGGRTTLSGLRTRGTLAYNPPESLQRMIDKEDVVLTPRGDVWALGVVMFMLLTGEHPFALDMSVSDEEMAQNVLEDSEKTPFPDEREEYADASDEQREEWAMRSLVSPEARDLIKRMLERNPAKRATADELLGHPWLRQPPPVDESIGIGGGDVFGQSEAKYRQSHEMEDAPPVTSEVLQRFWSARRKVKALLLAVMSGLVDGVLPDIAEEGEDSGRRLLEAGKMRLFSPEGGRNGDKGSKRGPWPWSESRLGHHAEAHANASEGPHGEVGEGMRLGMGSSTSSSASQQYLREHLIDGWVHEKAGMTAAHASFDASAVATFVAERAEKERELAAAKEELSEATAAAIALTDGRLAETISAAKRVSVATAVVEELERELERPLVDVVAAAAAEAAEVEADPSKRKRRPPYPIGSREAACAVIDRDKKGFITADDVDRVANLLGEAVSDSEVRDMMAAMDGDPSTEAGRVPYDLLSRVIPPLCPPIPFGVGKKLYREGDLDPNFYLLTKGVVEFSVSVLQGKAPLQRQGPGASFGEVELLRADGSTAPRLASCKCVGEKGHEDEGCEVLVVTGHTFELLTDVFYGIRMKLVNQAESRLTQLAGSVLRNALKGDEISMMGLDVIWGEKESNCVWNSVAPSRKKRRAPPFRGAASAIFSKAPSVSAPSPSPAPSSSGEGADEGGPSPVAARAITVEAVKDAVTAAETVAVTATSAPTAVALASGTALDGTSSMDSGANSSESLSSSSNPVAKEAAAASQGQASFVLLVLEGSVTAVYGGDVIEGGEAGDSEGDVGVQGPTHERVLEPGDFCFCGEDFGPDAPESPTLVTCKLWQRARVRRVPAEEFTELMRKDTMEALMEFMYSEV